MKRKELRVGLEVAWYGPPISKLKTPWGLKTLRRVTIVALEPWIEKKAYMGRFKPIIEFRLTTGRERRSGVAIAWYHAEDDVWVPEVADLSKIDGTWAEYEVVLTQRLKEEAERADRNAAFDARVAALPASLEAYALLGGADRGRVMVNLDALEGTYRKTPQLTDSSQDLRQGHRLPSDPRLPAGTRRRTIKREDLRVGMEVAWVAPTEGTRRATIVALEPWHEWVEFPERIWSYTEFRSTTGEEPSSGVAVAWQDQVLRPLGSGSCGSFADSLHVGGIRGDSGSRRGGAGAMVEEAGRQSGTGRQIRRPHSRVGCLPRGGRPPRERRTRRRHDQP